MLSPNCPSSSPPNTVLCSEPLGYLFPHSQHWYSHHFLVGASFPPPPHHIPSIKRHPVRTPACVTHVSRPSTCSAVFIQGAHCAFCHHICTFLTFSTALLLAQVVFLQPGQTSWSLGSHHMLSTFQLTGPWLTSWHHNTKAKPGPFALRPPPVICYKAAQLL